MERGPYTLQDMYTWWFGGFLPPTLSVKRKDSQFQPIASTPEFVHPYYHSAYYYFLSLPPAVRAASATSSSTSPSTSATTSTTTAATASQSAKSASYDDDYYPPSRTPAGSGQTEDERIAAQILLNDYTQTAAFNVRTGRFSSNMSGGWTDSAGRQMAHYFDVDAWQKTCQEVDQKKTKQLPKNFWKNYKAEKKKKKIPDYLKD